MTLPHREQQPGSVAFSRSIRVDEGVRPRVWIDRNRTLQASRTERHAPELLESAPGNKLME